MCPQPELKRPRGKDPTHTSGHACDVTRAQAEIPNGLMGSADLSSSPCSAKPPWQDYLQWRGSQTGQMGLPPPEARPPELNKVLCRLTIVRAAGDTTAGLCHRMSASACVFTPFRKYKLRA